MVSCRAAIADAEFLVPAGRATARYASCWASMAALRVVQTLSAGVEWVAPFLPAGVDALRRRRHRDITVAEWVLAAILASTKTLPRAMRSTSARTVGVAQER